MGPRAVSLIAATLALGATTSAWAQDALDAPCRGQTASGSPFATCFDPGNRLFTDVLTDNRQMANGAASGPSSELGLGFGLDVRHLLETDDPDVSWRLQHAIAHVRLTDTRVVGAVYRGRYLRHSRDGHLLLPLSPPKKLFVPFDIGMEVEAGHIDRNPDDQRFTLGVIRANILIELLRSNDFRKRLAIGPIVSWDVSVRADASAVDEHRVTPFASGLLDGYWESRSGLTNVHVRVQAGTVWSSVQRWQTEVDAQLALERVMIAVNDRPLSLFARVGYRFRPAPSDAMDMSDPATTTGWRAIVGARMAWSWIDRGR